MDDEEQETYRFKWSNYDLHDYTEARRAAARILRQKAALLTERAEQIEEEVNELRSCLVPASDG